MVLVEPEIPPNTGNVARTCVLTGTRLHLVKPLGFSLDDRYLRRSGLDYWQYLDLKVHPSFESFYSNYRGGRLIAFSTHGSVRYDQVVYRKGDYLMYGCETKGLQAKVLARAEVVVRIPMLNQVPRSLNLGNSVALTLYEALRQEEFPGMS